MVWTDMSLLSGQLLDFRRHLTTHWPLPHNWNILAFIVGSKINNYSMMATRNMTSNIVAEESKNQPNQLEMLIGACRSRWKRCSWAKVDNPPGWECSHASRAKCLTFSASSTNPLIRSWEDACKTVHEANTREPTGITVHVDYQYSRAASFLTEHNGNSHAW